MLTANPTVFPLVADLYAENLPLANTIDLKNRLKTLVPPEIVEAGKTGEMPQQGEQKPSPEEQAMQMEAQFKQAQIELKKQEQEFKIKELEQKHQLELAKMELQHLEYAASLEEQKLRYRSETDRTKSDTAISHANNITKMITHHAKQQQTKQQTRR